MWRRETGRPRSDGWDRGQVLPLMAVILVLIAAMLLLAVRVSGRLDAVARARTAADAAALAGAVEGERGARALAAANGGEIVHYEQVGLAVMVIVRVDHATHEAWAEATPRWELGSG